jgi:RNA polymerase sigma-70 factor (ECF subfamily)
VLLALLEERYFSRVEVMLARMRLSPDVLGEAKQRLREKLLVGAHPALAGYSGRGDLSSWIYAAATRTALNLLRDGKRELPADDELFLALPGVEADPEVALLREQHASELRTAFAEAFAALSPRERLFIQQHYVDGLSTDEIGRLYKMHRVTVLRWISRALDRVVARTHRTLVDRLGLRRSELDSFIRVVRSQLDISIRQLCK